MRQQGERDCTGHDKGVAHWERSSNATLLAFARARTSEMKATHEKYVMFASMYSMAQMPSPSGPVILSVLTGFLTLLST